MNAPLSARLKVAVHGAVQGVGFRPFVYRLAKELGLNGWVNNSVEGVYLEVEGRRADAEQFLSRLKTEKPQCSSIQNLEALWLANVGYKTFEIRPSETNGNKTAVVLPDIATCPDCLREIQDPKNRRYRYPFTNCTHCGPRFSIIGSIPYDRSNTSMRSFTMCPECRSEYEDPLNRRFHAQPNACPVCGPHLELWDCNGNIMSEGDQALRATAEAIRQGKVLAVKGLGGFHLMVGAHIGFAVQRLRERKHREEKPFALMFPSLAEVKAACEVSDLEERLLLSLEAPIVLLRKKANAKREISDLVAPGNPYLGVMLPYTPLHHLLMAEMGVAVVATSGNLKDEPMAFRETEALQRLAGIADFFLVHNRPIVRHVDDSIVRVIMNREMILRRARGFAPLPIAIKTSPRNRQCRSVLAVGAHLKNTVALSIGSQVFVSQHIGDLESEESSRAFRGIIADFGKLYETTPEIIAADLHPDYLSTRFAQHQAQSGKRHLVTVQHHVAHVLSCMVENELMPPVLGVSWDGTGLGMGGMIWGGEFFEVTEKQITRTAHFRPFRLPGGDVAVKEPRRCAAGLLFETLGLAGLEELMPTVEFSPQELVAIRTMLLRGVNSPLCCSVGRLFDGVAALVGLRHRSQFEGQAAMDLEFALENFRTNESYPLRVTDGNSGSQGSEGEQTQPSMLLDWFPLVGAVLADRQKLAAPAEISARFHNALAESIVSVAERSGQPRVVLSGGCFQNRYLTERTITRLREKGFQPYWHRRVPTNDGGICLGQIAAAWRKFC